MAYGVQVVQDHELPAGITRVIVEAPGPRVVLIVAESVAGSWRMLQAWQDIDQRDDAFELRAV